jgi:hypothetical protein
VDRAKHQAIVSVEELRRYGCHWYVGDFAFGNPAGWAAQNLERVWSAVGNHCRQQLAGGLHAESPASLPWHRRGSPIARFPRDLSTMLGRPSHPAN